MCVKKNLLHFLWLWGIEQKECQTWGTWQELTSINIDSDWLMLPNIKTTSSKGSLKHNMKGLFLLPKVSLFMRLCKSHVVTYYPDEEKSFAGNCIRLHWSFIVFCSETADVKRTARSTYHFLTPMKFSPGVLDFLVVKKYPSSK